MQDASTAEAVDKPLRQAVPGQARKRPLKIAVQVGIPMLAIFPIFIAKAIRPFPAQFFMLDRMP